MAAAIAKMKNKGGIAKTTKFKRSQSLSARAPKRVKLQPKEPPKEHKPYDHGFGGSKSDGPTGDTGEADANSSANAAAAAATAAAAAAAQETERKAKAEAEAKKASDAAAAIAAVEEAAFTEEDYSKERELVVYDDDF